MELMAVNKQWSTRPASERFLNLPDLFDVQNKLRHSSQSGTIRLGDMTAMQVDDDASALKLVGPNGNGAGISNWAFNQLCLKSELPASYISRLPAKLAADNINHALTSRKSDKVGMYISKFDDDLQIRAITGENYSRIYNAEVVQLLMDYVGDGVTGEWKVPGEFGKQVPITNQNTTIYGSDRDIFVCLVDEENRVEFPNRRHGETGTLARGFIIWNSEVGSQTFGITTFLFDYVCANRIIWGAQNVQTFKTRHTKYVLDRWEDGYKQIQEYANAKASEDKQILLAANAFNIVDLGKTITNESETERNQRRSDEASKFLKTKLALPAVTNKLVDGIKASFLKAEERPMLTLWDAVTGTTEFAKTIEHQDERVLLERAGGKLLDLVAKDITKSRELVLA